MTYSAILATISGKRPAWLYEFSRGGTTVRFARSGSDVSALSETWTAKPITHTRFMRTAQVERGQTELVFPQSDTWARTYLGGGAYIDNSVRIYHGFLNDPDNEWRTMFRGRVVGVRTLFTRIVLLVEASLTEMRREARPAVMQRICRHALYGDGCGLAIADWETAGTATAISGRDVTCAAASSEANGYYSGGVITFAGIRQSIISHTGSTLRLFGELPGLEDEITASGSASVAIAPGCRLTRAVCNDRFSNLANFGGFPWMEETPFDGRKLY